MSDVRLEILLGEIKKELLELKELLRQVLETLRLQMPYVAPGVPYDPQPYYPPNPYPYTPVWSGSDTKSMDTGTEVPDEA